MAVEEVAAELNPRMLLLVLAIPNDGPLKGKLVTLSDIFPFSALAISSAVSTPEVVDAVEGGVDEDPKLKMGAAGNEGAGAEFERALLKAVAEVVAADVMVEAPVEEGMRAEELLTI